MGMGVAKMDAITPIAMRGGGKKGGAKKHSHLIVLVGRKIRGHSGEDLSSHHTGEVGSVRATRKSQSTSITAPVTLNRKYMTLSCQHPKSNLYRAFHKVRYGHPYSALINCSQALFHGLRQWLFARIKY